MSRQGHAVSFVGASAVTRNTPNPHAVRRRTVLGDIALLAAGTLLIYLIAAQQDWFARISHWALTSRFHQLDETLLAGVFLAVGLAIFAVRRWREARRDAIARQRTQRELEELHATLAERVWQRTADLTDEVERRKQAQEKAAASEARYRQLFRASPLPMWIYDLQTLSFLAVNHAAIARYGFSRNQFLRMTIRDIGVADQSPTAQVEQPDVADANGHTGVCRHRRADGSIISVEITSHAITYDGRAARLVMAHDVTERLEQDRRIARLSRIRAVIGGVSSAMLRLHDRQDLLREACRVSCIEGVFPAAWIVAFEGTPPRPSVLGFHAKDPADIELVRRVLERVPLEDQPGYRATRTGQPVIVNDVGVDVSLAPMREELIGRGLHAYAAFPLIRGDQVSASMVLVAREPGFFDEEEAALVQWLTGDISYALAHIEASQRLDRLVHFDPLTGLANAQLFRERLDQLVTAARQSRDALAVVVLDLEHFTRVNDAFGRGVGDRLLREVGERVRVRVPEPHLLARIGADTFAVSKRLQHTSDVGRLIDEVSASLSEAFVLDGHAIRVSAQAGIAVFPADGEDAQQLFKNAEVALKAAKDSERPHTYYSHGMQERMARRVALETQLRSAVEQQQFVLNYQGRIDIVSGELAGAEALIRWNHPQRGMISPGEFIELAEGTGLIVPIGAWVIDQVCAQLACWIDAGVPVVPVAVNVSSVQLEQSDLVGVIRAALERHDVNPRLLEVELTESAVMADPDGASRILRTLQDLGVRLALDDFGTGYSSLAHLKTLPFQVVKIDKSFIVDITRKAEDAAIASAIIAMAHRLSLKVVAEGVETAAQLNHLRSAGCDAIQGFLFSAAVPAQELEAQLRDGKAAELPAPARSPAGERCLLLVDDEAGIRSALVRTLRRDGYKILTAASGDEALDILALHPVQVIVSDQRMPGMSGTDFLNVASQLYPDTLRIILSGFTDLQVVTDSVNRGAVFKFLTKPWDDELLRDQIRDAFRRFRPQERYVERANSSR